ncbi:MAG: hypothetical protein KAH48_01310, partial [Chlorobi bacterium]|nr:hypothetical protein [Chlorobiota bacterium]
RNERRELKEKNHPLTPSLAGGGTRKGILDGFHFLQWILSSLAKKAESAHLPKVSSPSARFQKTK